MLGERGSPSTERDSEPTRVEFHPTLHPADRFAFGERSCRALDHVVVGYAPVYRTDFAQTSFNASLGKCGSKVSAVHSVVHTVGEQRSLPRN